MEHTDPFLADQLILGILFGIAIMILFNIFSALIKQKKNNGFDK